MFTFQFRDSTNINKTSDDSYGTTLLTHFPGHITSYLWEQIAM